MAYRKLVINNETWEYSVGKGAKIRSPKGKSVWIDGWQLLGYNNKSQYIHDKYDKYRDDFECEDRNYNMPITPAIIKKYIEENLT